MVIILWANVSSAKVPTSPSSSWAFLGIPTVIKSLKIDEQKCKRGTDFDFDSSDDRKLSCPPFVGMETCSVWQPKGQPWQAGREGTGIGMCVSALTPPNCQLLSSLSPRFILTARVGVKEAFFNFKQKAATPKLHFLTLTKCTGV